MGLSRFALLAAAALPTVSQGAASTASVQVVLAHFAEDLAWIDPYEEQGADFIVYSKSSPPPNGAVILPNVGREAHTYLYHIVRRYQHLANWTVFSQAVEPSWGYQRGGDVSGHLSDTVEFADYLRPFPDGHDSFFVLSAASQFPSAWQSKRVGYMIKNLRESARGKSMCPPGAASGWTAWYWDEGHPHLSSKPSDMSMLEFYHRFIAGDDYTDEPLTLAFAQGARFAVSRERIHSRPKEYYEALLERLSHSEMPVEGYWMEAAWYDVFHPEALQSKHQPCTLPAMPPQGALTIPAMQADTQRWAHEGGLLTEEAGEVVSGRSMSQASSSARAFGDGTLI